MSKCRFTKISAGCYADSAFGHEHVRAKLAELVEPLDQRLASELLGKMSDDASEEDDAIAKLNGQCSDDVHFGFVDGDLMLVYTGDACPDCNGVNGHRRHCPASL